MIWPQRDGAVVIRERIAETFHLMERDTAVHQCLDEVGSQREHPIVTDECFGTSPQRLQGDAANVERFGMVRPQAKRAVVAHKRLVIPLHGVQDARTIVEYRDMFRLQRSARS